MIIDREYIRQIIADLLELNVTEIKDNSRFFLDLDMDSMTFMELFHKLEKEFDLTVGKQKFKIEICLNDVMDSLNRCNINA